MWHYVCYKAYLDFIKKSNYNGNETFIYQKIQNQDISWFPVKRLLKFLFINFKSSGCRR